MAQDKSDTVDVTIRIDKQRSGQMDEIVRALEARGLSRIERHERFAMLNGSVSASRLDSLREVQGVASVRQDRTYKTQAD